MNKKLENIKACKLKKKWQENHQRTTMPCSALGKKKRFVEREDKEINLGEGDMEEQDEELKKQSGK